LGRSRRTRLVRRVLICRSLAAAVVLLASHVAVTEFHHVYLSRLNLPDLGPFTRFEFPTIGRVYDARGKPLIELAREYREIERYEDTPPIVRDAILAAEDKRFFSHSGMITSACLARSGRPGSACSWAGSCGAAGTTR
jgi:penicillin-binding protein 1A